MPCTQGQGIQEASEMGVRKGIGGGLREARQWQARHRHSHSCTRSWRQCRSDSRTLEEQEQLQNKLGVGEGRQHKSISSLP